MIVGASAAGLPLAWLPLMADALRPDPGEARRWAQEELARAGYQKSFLERILESLRDWLGGLFDVGQGAPGGQPVPGAFAVVAFSILAVLVGLIIRARNRRVASGDVDDGPRDDDVFAGRQLRAGEHRRLAEAALGRGDASQAVVEGFRALAARLLERHVLDEARDRTAQEFGSAAVAAFPQHAKALRAAAQDFDETRYGGIASRPGQARRILALDTTLTTATPLSVDPARQPSPLAAPR